MADSATYNVLRQDLLREDILRSESLYHPENDIVFPGTKEDLLDYARTSRFIEYADPRQAYSRAMELQKAPKLSYESANQKSGLSGMSPRLPFSTNSSFIGR